MRFAFIPPRIARHFNIKKPAVIEATIRAGMPVTLFRFWRLDGKYLMTAREGETIKPRRHLMATNGLAKMKADPGEWFENLCHAGMPHLSGQQLARFLRNNDKLSNVPIVLLTGQENRGAASSPDDTIDAFLYKPVKAVELKSCLAGLLRRT